MDAKMQVIVDALMESMRERVVKMCESAELCFVRKNGPSMAEIIALSIEINERPAKDFFVRSNRRASTDSRRLAWWYLVDVMGHRPAEVAEITGHDRTTVMNLVRDFKDKLDVGDKLFVRISNELKEAVKQIESNENNREDQSGN